MTRKSSNGRNQPTEPRFSRRGLLTTGAATAGALLIGAAGTAGAAQETGRFNDSPGRGGEAITPEDDFRDQPFRITGRTGDTATEIDGAVFNCNEGNGESIFLVGWYFEYTDDSQQRLLFTRSNNIDTTREYTWGASGAKLCEDSGVVLSEGGLPSDFVQSSYRATGPQ